MAKFYQLTRAERLATLVSEGRINQAEADYLQANTVLPEATASHLTENQVGQFALPYGIVRGLQVNGAVHDVALAGEEPSVVAAASNGARMTAAGGGIAVVMAPHILTAEVVFADVADEEAAVSLINAREAEIFATAAAAHPSITKRGGGLRAVSTQLNGNFVKISLDVDPRSAMGANIANTIAEAVGALIGGWLGQQPLMAILSNYSSNATVAKVDVPFAALATKTMDGATVARRIALASIFARQDVERAVTNNKGIMNGIAAATIALGNDYRAVEACAHAFAAHTGTYQPLSCWRVQRGSLHGELTVPLQLGVVGGAISALPLATISQHLAGVETVTDAQTVVAAVGLAQNLAALRALVGPGIQAGHMALQAGALAVAAGANGSEVEVLTQLLQDSEKTLANAKQLLAEIRTH